MPLERKVITFLTAFFVAYCGLVYGVHRFIIRPGIDSLQAFMAEKDLQRSMQTLNRELHHLSTVCWDWASWDEAYSFVETPSPRFIRVNMGVTSFTDNQLNLICILDRQGGQVWGEIRDHETGKALPGERLFQALCSPASPLMIREESNAPIHRRVVSGFYANNESPMIVAARPILTTDNRGPFRGTLILGRFLTSKLVETLSAQTQVKFSIAPIRETAKSLTPVQKKTLTASDRPLIVRKQVPDGPICIMTSIEDINGKASLALAADVTPTVERIAKANFRFALVTLIAAGFCMIGLTGLVIQFIIIRPITRLTDSALAIRRSGDATGRLAMVRNDEIGSMAKEFNGMLEMLTDQSSRMEEINAQLQRDLLRRDRAEQELKKSEDYYRTILASMGEDLLVVDNDQRVRNANKEVLPTLKRDRASVIGIPFIQLMEGYRFPTSHGDDKFLIEKVIQTGTPRNYRIHTQANRPGECHLDLVLSPISRKERGISEVIVSIRDVTNEVRLERLIIQLQKIEAIGIMAAGISHEFNNILMSILLNLEIAIRQIDDAELCETLTVSHQAATRAAQLVKQLLLFSRGRKRNHEPLSATPLIKEILKIVQASLPATIQFRLDLQAENDRIMATPDQIQQMVVNLCQNAVHAMRDRGGVLKVETANTAYDNDEAARTAAPDLPSGRYLVLTVKDTGEGMEDSIVHRIFDPFFTMKQTGAGPGLGLSAVHGIVNDLHGAVKVDSTPGQGSRFRIFIPTAGEGVKPEPYVEESGMETVFGRVMVVEDEPILATAIQDALSHFGYHATVCLDSGEALERFKADPDDIDIMITDLTMPEMLGTELAKEVHRHRPELPIILCTGYYDAVDEGEIAGTDIHVVVKKPLNLFELEAIVRKELAKLE